MDTKEDGERNDKITKYPPTDFTGTTMALNIGGKYSHSDYPSIVITMEDDWSKIGSQNPYSVYTSAIFNYDLGDTYETMNAIHEFLLKYPLLYGPKEQEFFQRFVPGNVVLSPAASYDRRLYVTLLCDALWHMDDLLEKLMQAGDEHLDFFNLYFNNCRNVCGGREPKGSYQNLLMTYGALTERAVQIQDALRAATEKLVLTLEPQTVLLHYKYSDMMYDEMRTEMKYFLDQSRYSSTEEYLGRRRAAIGYYFLMYDSCEDCDLPYLNIDSKIMQMGGTVAVLDNDWISFSMESALGKPQVNAISCFMNLEQIPAEKALAEAIAQRNDACRAIELAMENANELGQKKAWQKVCHLIGSWLCVEIHSPRYGWKNHLKEDFIGIRNNRGGGSGPQLLSADINFCPRAFLPGK